MTLRLFAHPLSSYCWKALIPLYEAGTPFTFEMLEFGAAEGPIVEFMQRWPVGKMPLLRDEARALLDKAYGWLEETLSDGRTWAAGEAYSVADVSASPSLFYAQRCHAWGDRPALQAYYDRLEARPSFQRVIAEAQPYMHMFPGGPAY